MRLDIIYGLSGSGKSTLCKNIEGAFYIDISTINFREIGMIEAFKIIYDRNKGHDYYVTEACLGNNAYREYFISSAGAYLRPHEMNIFYIETDEDDWERMSKIRSWTVERYQNEVNQMIIRDDVWNHYRIKSKTLEERLEFVKNINKK